MKNLYIFKIFKSNYCKAVFAISLVISYLLIPKKIFYGFYTIIGIIYMIAFSLAIVCIVRNIKEKVLLARTYQGSLIGIIAAAIGLAALQVCGVGAPVCGAAVGGGILSAVVPNLFASILADYALYIIIAAIIIQIIALYFMNCFKKWLR